MDAPCVLPCQAERVLTTNGRWTPRQANLHITAREALAAANAISLAIQIRDSMPGRVLLVTDSVATRAALASGSSSWTMNWAVQKAITALAAARIELSTAYIPSKENPADAPSRQLTVDGEDWKLLRPYFLLACKAFRLHPNLDLFATLANRQCQEFISATPQPEALLTDAWTANWGRLQRQGYTLYANPPFSLMMRVLQKAKAELIHPMMLVVPVWPARPWWPLLTEMTSRVLDMDAEYAEGGVHEAPRPRWRTQARLIRAFHQDQEGDAL
jgi:hypothetical protein